MAKLRIKTCNEFEIALRAVPFASARLASFESHLHDRRSEMSTYVAFLEDVRLPKDRTRLRAFWRHAPEAFATAIKQDRGLR